MGSARWETEQQVLEGVLADSALGDARVQRNALQHFLDDTVAGIEPDQIAIYACWHRFTSSGACCVREASKPEARGCRVYLNRPGGAEKRCSDGRLRLCLANARRYTIS